VRAEQVARVDERVAAGVLRLENEVDHREQSDGRDRERDEAAGGDTAGEGEEGERRQHDAGPDGK